MLQEIELLQDALEHVEDIDDEDETRILREPMDALQVHIKEALQSKRPQRPYEMKNSADVKDAKSTHHTIVWAKHLSCILHRQSGSHTLRAGTR